MSLEILDQLEEKIKQAVETIQLLQLEVEELKANPNKKTYNSFSEILAEPEDE